MKQHISCLRLLLVLKVCYLWSVDRTKTKGSLDLLPRRVWIKRWEAKSVWAFLTSYTACLVFVWIVKNQVNIDWVLIVWLLKLRSECSLVISNVPDVIEEQTNLSPLIFPIGMMLDCRGWQPFWTWQRLSKNKCHWGKTSQSFCQRKLSKKSWDFSMWYQIDVGKK